MSHLIRFILSEEDNKIVKKIVKTCLVTDSQMLSHIQPTYANLSPIFSIYGNHSVTMSPTHYMGDFTLYNLTNNDIMEFLLDYGQLDIFEKTKEFHKSFESGTIKYKTNDERNFRIQVFRNIDSFDDEDIEMALNIRSVHVSPDADHDFKNCVVKEFQTSEHRNLETWETRMFLSSITFNFNSPI